MGQCSAEVRDSGGWHYYPCGNKAKMQHEGKGYCGVHDPVKREVKRKAQSAKWSAGFKARMKNAEEERHKLDTWQGLVETLAQILYESHNPVVEKLAQDALNIAQPPGTKLEP